MNHKFRRGDVHRVEITSIAFGGEGIGRIDQMAIFVPFTVEGDLVDVEVREIKKSYLRGKVTKVVHASPDRVTPPCPYFGRCGGCQYQHIRYEKQVAAKERQVVEAFERIGRIHSPPVLPILPSSRTFGYRGKAEYHFHHPAGAPPAIGFMDVRGDRVIDIERCAIMDESINRASERLRRNLVVGRGSPREGKWILWADPDDEKKGEGDQAAGEPEYIERKIGAKKMRVPYQGFSQANVALIETLVALVVDSSGLSKSDTVIECYSGSGLFSLFLADRCRQIFGIEVDHEAVSCARMNLERYGQTNGRFFEGDVGQILQEQFSMSRDPIDVVILDPPRNGCDREVVSSVIAISPRRIVYIACDPATQARDAAIFLGGGYLLKTVQPIDMFPQTKHIETVAVLEKKSV
jgi:23S rRNA (uracil1939-C5)-methyltransferase